MFASWIEPYTRSWKLLQRVPNERLYVTDLTRYSIGIIQLKLENLSRFVRHVPDRWCAPAACIGTCRYDPRPDAAGRIASIVPSQDVHVPTEDLLPSISPV